MGTVVLNDIMLNFDLIRRGNYGGDKERITGNKKPGGVVKKTGEAGAAVGGGGRCAAGGVYRV